MNGQSRIKYTQFSIILVAVLFLSLLSYYPAQAKKSYTYYVHKTSKLYTSSNSAKQFIRYVPINAKLKTTSKKTSKMVKVTYGGRSGYVFRSNLWTKRTTKTRYIHKTSYLYSSRDASKQRTWKIAINKKLTTDSNLNYKMYHVNYKGKRGYVYKSNLSPYKTTIVKYVKKKSKQYKNYSRTKRYSGTIPLGTRLETQSPQSNKLFWVSYKGRKSYVYAVNLTNAELSYTYNNPVAANTYGVVSTGGNHGIWDQPYGIKDAKSVGNIADYERVPLNVLRESEVGGVVWYQVSVDGRTLGWIHKSIVQLTSNTASDGSIPHLAVASVAKPNSFLYQSPGNGVITSLNIYANLRLKIDMIANNGEWVHIKKYTAGTSLGWARASDLSIQSTSAGKALNVNYGATIASSKAPIFDDQDHFVGYSGQFNADGRHVQINQEKQVENEERYRISYNNHVIGWVVSTALNLNNSTMSYQIVKNTGAIYNGQSNGDAPDTGLALGSLSAYTNRMLEVIKTSGDWSFIKYNDWYGKMGKDIDLGWVRSSDLSGLRSGTADFRHLFTAGGGNQQGLAYNPDLGLYYVGYDTGDGTGKIVAYDQNGNYKGSSAVTTFGHACALSYIDGKLYEVSSAGQKPILHEINPDPNNLSITKTTTLTSFPYYVAMMTAKDSNTLILLTESVGGKDTFYEYTISTGKLTQTAQMNKMGIVQGMHYENGKLYFLANNYLTVLNGNYAIEDRFQFSIPNGGTPQESEGLTMVNGKLAIGFADHTIYIQN
ncbi:MAG: GW domain-containing glycosaminoglycan-binding protein [Sporolactobacillus sp.]|uniref:GW domain-containing glycosaminoglycan-binding protein n=1 Tax=Sporolactobacillus sp. STSJ-5 TaxID=2965076 RepID=UPI002108563C|nr:GW domain-containing glycosaminoglycan-binding protein [Sporolactobacillus sp. STSJ-5]